MTNRTGSHGVTTHPESVTGGSDGAPVGAAIRWVFPTPWTTPVTGGGVIGREADCAIVLPGKDVSRHHAEVRRAAVPGLRDLQSRNGTWLNGQKIDAERPLGPGDLVRIGEWVGLVVELSQDDPSPDLVEIGKGWFGGPSLARAIAPSWRVAASELPVIVQGETGTGKEGMARAVHAWSRRGGAFIGVNCAAIQPAMAEGELFGYRKGAFTGADRANEGFFRAADGGTLFLDEILELPPAVQSKLLRALKQGEVQPLGEPRPVRVNVRIICATQEPLSRAVAEKRFRADLLARLDGVTVTLPPLRERREDIAPLFLRLLHDLSGGRAPVADSKVIEALLLYDWPLNIRELALLARRILAIHGHEPALKRSMLPERMTASMPSLLPIPDTRAERSPTADDAAFEQFLLALRAVRGNVSRAAASLGISRARAYRLLEARPGFDVRSLRDDDDKP